MRTTTLTVIAMTIVAATSSTSTAQQPHIQRAMPITCGVSAKVHEMIQTEFNEQLVAGWVMNPEKKIFGFMWYNPTTHTMTVTSYVKDLDEACIISSGTGAAYTPPITPGLEALDTEN